MKNDNGGKNEKRKGGREKEFIRNSVLPYDIFIQIFYCF